MSKREFLMLAHTRKPKDYVCEWFMSEKLDGLRCFWDGAISRGLPCTEVPWANVEKHARFLTPQVATGLWTRLGQPILAPAWWVKHLPKDIPLDGELVTGRQKFQEVSGIVRTKTFDHPGWAKVQYHVFEAPALSSVLYDGYINTTMFKKRLSGCIDWCKQRGPVDLLGTWNLPYYRVLPKIQDVLRGNEVASPVEQKVLPQGTHRCEIRVQYELEHIESLNGEGLMLRNPLSPWSAERTKHLLKVKSWHDMEGIVIGYTWGRATDLDRSVSGESTNKMLGLMGSVRLRLDSGVELDLSGFTEEERVMCSDMCGEEWVKEIGIREAGNVVEDAIYNRQFPRGSRITFKYRELSNDGVPKEARYLRKREE